MMKLRTTIALAVTVMAIGSSAQAQSGKNDPRLIKLQGGMLNDRCGSFLEAERTRSPEWSFYMAWLQGYITAYNMYAAFPASYKQRDIAHGTDIADWSAWIKNYCTANPLNLYINAIDALMVTFGAEPSLFGLAK